MRRITVQIQFLSGIILLFILISSVGCKKELPLVPDTRKGICENIDEHLYNKSWVWVGSDGTKTDVSTFYQNSIARTLLLNQDTILHYQTQFHWMNSCDEFVKEDSHPEVLYQIKHVSPGLLIMTRYFDMENEQELRFEAI